MRRLPKAVEDRDTVSIYDKRKALKSGDGVRTHRRPRHRFLETDVTSEECEQIVEYCLANRISVSQFLADLILEAAAAAKVRKPAVRIDDLELTAKEYDKLELLVHLHKKNSVAELIRDLLQPHLESQKVHAPSEKARSLRFYLDDREHETVTTYLANRGLTARKYVCYLAIRTIAKSRKNRRQGA